MIWIILFLVIVAISLFLALRSMRDYYETPAEEPSYSLFLVRNLSALNLETLDKIWSFLKENGQLISFERLYKGKQNVVVLYASSVFAAFFSNQLDLLELEDYLTVDPGDGSDKKVAVTQSYLWVISAKNNIKKLLNPKENFLSELNLEEDQKFFWQIVCSPESDNQIGNFQVTIRGLVSDPESVNRIELAKRVINLINETTGLLRKPKEQNSATLFESFYHRAFVPKQVAPFVLTKAELLKLLNLT